MDKKVIDFSSFLKGSRFAVTFLDYALRDQAVPDELMIEKSGEHHKIYYKNKQGDIIQISGPGSGSVSPEDLEQIETKITKVLKDSKDYTDKKVKEIVDAGGGTGGSTSMVKYNYTIDVELDNTSQIQIPLDTFSKDDDLLLVSTNTVLPSPEDTILGYSVSDSGLITFNTPFSKGSSIYIIIVKNVPTGTTGSVNANILTDKSITVSKLSQEVLNLIGSSGGGGMANIPVTKEQPPVIVDGTMWFQLEK